MTPQPGSPRGFLTGFMGAIGPKMDRAHEEEQASIKEQRANAWSELQDVLTDAGKKPEEQKYKGDHNAIAQEKWKAYQKYLSPETKKKSSPLGQLFQKLVPPKAKGVAPQAQGEAPTQPGAQPQAQGGGTQLQAPAAQSQLGGPGQLKTPQEQTQEQQAAAKAKTDEAIRLAQSKPVRPTTLQEKKDQLHQAYLDLGKTEEEATKLVAESITAPKPHALQAGWAKTPDGKLIAIRVDPQNPGKVLNANTGGAVPEGTEQVNPTMITAQMRQDSYGSFGNYYRSLRGQGVAEPEAREKAAEMVEREFNVRLTAQEQEIGIKKELSGVGGGGGVELPKPTPPLSGATPSATPSETPSPTTAPKRAPPLKTKSDAVAPDQTPFINMYLQRLFGNMPGGNSQAALVGANRGMSALAKASGMSPSEFQTAAAVSKEKVKALGDTVERYGAMVRLTDLLDSVGETVIDTAQKFVKTGSPMANRALKSIDLATVGDPGLREYLLTINDFSRHYATLTAGGALSKAMLPVTVQQDVDNLISPNMTVAESIAVVERIKKQAGVEKTGYKNAIKDLGDEIKTGALGGKPSPNGTLTPPASGGAGAPKTADEYLKSIK